MPSQDKAERRDINPAILAAEQMDWMQVVLNHSYGPPCFYIEPSGRFCGRAQGWAGHGDINFHGFISLADLVRSLTSAGRLVNGK